MAHNFRIPKTPNKNTSGVPTFHFLTDDAIYEVNLKTWNDTDTWWDGLPPSDDKDFLDEFLALKRHFFDKYFGDGRARLRFLYDLIDIANTPYEYYKEYNERLKAIRGTDFAENILKEARKFGLKIYEELTTLFIKNGWPVLYS